MFDEIRRRRPRGSSWLFPVLAATVIMSVTVTVADWATTQRTYNERLKFLKSLSWNECVSITAEVPIGPFPDVAGIWAVNPMLEYIYRDISPSLHQRNRVTEYFSKVAMIDVAMKRISKDDPRWESCREPQEVLMEAHLIQP